MVTEDGDRRDLARYEVDETERGSEGRCDVAGERGVLVVLLEAPVRLLLG